MASNTSPQSTPNDPFEAAVNQQVHSGITGNNPQTLTSGVENPSLLQSFFKGLIGGAANTPISTTGSGLGNIPNDYQMDTQVGRANPTDTEKQTSQLFPKADISPKARSIQDLGEAFSNPLTYALGPAGIGSTAISGGVTAWRNAESPDTPGKNAAIGMGAGMLPWGAPLTAGKAMGQAAGALKEDNPILQAQRDLGITNRNAAGIGPTDSWPKTIRDLRESWLSSSVNDHEKAGREQVENAFDKQTGPVASRSEAGQLTQSELDKWQNSTETELGRQHTLLNNYIDPSTTKVDIQPAIDRLRKAFTPPPGAPQMDPGASNLVTKIEQQAKEFAYQQQYGQYWQQNMANNSPLKDGLKIPLSAIDYMKSNVADDLKLGLLDRGETSIKNNKIAYATLADAQSSVYKGTPFEQFHKDLNNGWHDYFTNLENVHPLMKDAGISTGNTYTNLVNQSPKDADKINQTLNLLPPEVRQTVAGVKVRELATGTDGQFNPGAFAKNWDNFKKISPEARDALFGPNAEAYDKLALVSQEQARSEAAKNASGTAGVRNAFQMFSKFATAGAAMTAGYEVSQGNSPSDDYGREVGINSGITGTLGTIGAMSIGARLFSNPGFVRLLATNPPIEKLPLALKALAVNQPQLSTEITAFQNYVQASHQQEQDKANDPFERATKGSSIKPQQKASGGIVTLPDQTQTGYTAGGIIKSQSNFRPDTQPSPAILENNEIKPPSTMDNPIRTPNGRGILDNLFPELKYPQAKEFNSGGPTAQWLTGQQGYAEGGLEGRDNPEDMFSDEENFARNQQYAKQGPYLTELQPDQEKQFQSWVKDNNINYHDGEKAYDMRGFWQAQQQGDKSAKSSIDPNDNKLHFPDTFKTPYAATFSNESKYATPNAPHWDGDKYIDKDGNLLYDDIKGKWTGPKKLALGGLTDTRKPEYGTKGYVGGGSVWGGNQPIPFANGGSVNSTDILSDDDLHKATPFLVNTVMPRESNGKNIMNYIGDKTHTAQGYFQITNTNWRAFAPLLGLQTEGAMKSSFDDQLKVAALMYKKYGEAPWDKAHGGLIPVKGSDNSILSQVKGPTTVTSSSILDQVMANQEEDEDTTKETNNDQQIQQLDKQVQEAPGRILGDV